MRTSCDECVDIYWFIVSGSLLRPLQNLVTRFITSIMFVTLIFSLVGATICFLPMIFYFLTFLWHCLLSIAVSTNLSLNFFFFDRLRPWRNSVNLFLLPSIFWHVFLFQEWCWGQFLLCCFVIPLPLVWVNYFWDV